MSFIPRLGFISPSRKKKSPFSHKYVDFTTSMLYGLGGSEVGTLSFAHPHQGDAQLLWNFGLAAPLERRFSRTYRGRGEIIDHILVGHALSLTATARSGSRSKAASRPM